MSKLLRFQSRGMQNWGKWLMEQHREDERRQRELLEKIAERLHDQQPSGKQKPEKPQASHHRPPNQGQRY